MSKKILSAILCLLLAFTVVGSEALPVSAETTTPEVLTKLLKKFPHRSYWNHVGSDKNAPDKVTDRPCPDHKSCGWEEGACTCNSFFTAIQCMGFAYKTAYDIVGSDPRTWEKTTELDASKLRVGDIIRYRWNQHSLTVTGVKGNIISFVDANWYPMCQIRWDQMDLDDMPGFTYVQHDPKNKLKNKNINFYTDSAEKKEKEFFEQPTKSENWITTAAVNIRKTASEKADVLYTVTKDTTLSPTQKKKNGNYLWGKVKYGSCEGWVALDNCEYVSGEKYAPKITLKSNIQPLGESFKVNWSEVQGADKYKLYVYDLYGKKIKTVDAKTNSASIKLSETGKFLLLVKSQSSHASSWVLTSADKYVTIRNKKDIFIETIVLNNSSLKLQVGEEAKLTYTYDPYVASDDCVFWLSNDISVAEVDGKGNVLGMSYGKTKVVCKSDDQNSASAVCTVTVCPAQPGTMKQDTGKLSTDSVTLKWSKVDGVSGYNVYRKKSDGKLKLVGTTAKTSYKETGLSPSTEYVYIIRSFVDIGKNRINGFDSDEFSAVTVPEKVSDLKVKTASGKATLSWKKNSKVSSYMIYQYSAKNDKYTRIGMTEKNSFTVKGKVGQKATYKVRAVKTVGNKNYASDYSAKVSVRFK